MSQRWNVTVEGEVYDIEYINNKKIIVNGRQLRLKDYQSKLTMTTTEHEIPLGSQKALLIVQAMNRAQLIMDGVDCASGDNMKNLNGVKDVKGGTEHVPAKLPNWTYIFIMLHCVNLLNGLSGCAAAILGIGAIKLICDSTKMSTAQKVLLNLGVLILAYALTFGAAILAAF
ncbi:MAG: hypothetical protein K2L82_11935 [Lachnospiraceae bacterium]|nr:hypothetical protein [Lachnospiraceae bacterium]